MFPNATTNRPNDAGDGEGCECSSSGGDSSATAAATASAAATATAAAAVVDKSLVEQVTRAVLAVLQQQQQSSADPATAAAAASSQITLQQVSTIVDRQLASIGGGGGGNGAAAAAAAEDQVQPAKSTTGTAEAAQPSGTDALPSPRAVSSAAGHTSARGSRKTSGRRPHRIFRMPINISYSPTPISQLERRHSTYEPCFSDDDDDRADSSADYNGSGGGDDSERSVSCAYAPASIGAAATSYSATTHSSSATATATTASISSATTTTATSTSSSNDFDLLEQIMAESSRSPKLLDSRQRRRQAQSSAAAGAAAGGLRLKSTAADHSTRQYVPTSGGIRFSSFSTGVMNSYCPTPLSRIPAATTTTTTSSSTNIATTSSSTTTASSSTSTATTSSGTTTASSSNTVTTSSTSAGAADTVETDYSAGAVVVTGDGAGKTSCAAAIAAVSQCAAADTIQAVGVTGSNVPPRSPPLSLETLTVAEHGAVAASSLVPPVGSAVPREAGSGPKNSAGGDGSEAEDDVGSGEGADDASADSGVTSAAGFLVCSVPPSRRLGRRTRSRRKPSFLSGLMTTEAQPAAADHHDADQSRPETTTPQPLATPTLSPLAPPTLAPSPPPTASSCSSTTLLPSTTPTSASSAAISLGKDLTVDLKQEHCVGAAVFVTDSGDGAPQIYLDDDRGGVSANNGVEQASERAPSTGDSSSGAGVCDAPVPLSSGKSSDSTPSGQLPVSSTDALEPTVAAASSHKHSSRHKHSSSSSGSSHRHKSRSSSHKDGHHHRDSHRHHKSRDTTERSSSHSSRKHHSTHHSAKATKRPAADETGASTKAQQSPLAPASDPSVHSPARSHGHKRHRSDEKQRSRTTSHRHSSSGAKHRSTSARHSSKSSSSHKRKRSPDSEREAAKSAAAVTAGQTAGTAPAAVGVAPTVAELPAAAAAAAAAAGDASGGGHCDISDDDSMDEADRVLAECERLFNEYEPSPSEQDALHQAKEMRDRAAREASQLAADGGGGGGGKASGPVAKRRLAHSGSELVARNSGARTARRVSAVQAMQARWLKLAEMQQARIVELEETAKRQQQQQLEPQQQQQQPSQQQVVPTKQMRLSGSSQLLCRPPTAKKIRVAHVPNVSALLNRPSTSFSSPLSTAASLSTTAAAAAAATTVARTVAKGCSRVAHQPSLASVSRPRVIGDSSAKVPVALRQRHLDLLCGELEKHWPDNQAEAFKQALSEEEAAYQRATSRTSYPHAIAAILKRLRSTQSSSVSCRLSSYSSSATTAAAAAAAATASGEVVNHVISHTSILAGKGGTLSSWSFEKTKRTLNISSEVDFHRLLTPYKLTEEQLDANWYPRADPSQPGRALLLRTNPYMRVTPAGSVQRSCVRCRAVYQVDDQGRQVRHIDQCVYHWGRVFSYRGERRYNCCSSEHSSEGCCLADVHVSDNYDPDCLFGFQETFSKPDSPGDDTAVFALDCEMCYTTGGVELTRVTVVDMTCAVVYDALVRPPNPIIDYNTRFSGITAEHMASVTTTISDVQAVLLNMFSDKTILIGHGLNGDLKALKLIHSSVVDTSVVFPHRLGPPLKRALRNLSSEFLQKIIQNGDEGHDSAEDARACVELMLWKLKEDAKRFR